MKTFSPNTIYADDAIRLLPTWPTESIDLLLTDPPYGNNVAYGRARRRIAGDEHPLVGLQAVAASYRLLKRDCTAYVFCAAHHLGFIEHFFLRYSQFRIRDVIIWDKRQFGFGRPFRRAYECVLVLEKGSPQYRERSVSNLLSVPRVSARLHPHAKPVALLEHLIRLSSDPGDVVLDPFAGSGSTCLAAHNLGRRFVGIEIDPMYAEVARRRIAEEARVA